MQSKAICGIHGFLPSRKVNPEQAKMIDYIDKVMSIPSCVSSVSSKVRKQNVIDTLNQFLSLSRCFKLFLGDNA